MPFIINSNKAKLTQPSNSNRSLSFAPRYSTTTISAATHLLPSERSTQAIIAHRVVAFKILTTQTMIMGCLRRTIIVIVVMVGIETGTIMMSSWGDVRKVQLWRVAECLLRHAANSLPQPAISSSSSSSKTWSIACQKRRRPSVTS